MFPGRSSQYSLTCSSAGRSPTADTSVTVVAPDATTADAYSTAAFVMDDDRASPLLDDREGVAALFLTRDGDRRRTDGWADRLADD